MRRLIAAMAVALFTLTFAAGPASATPSFSNIVIASTENATESEATFATDTAELFLSANLADAASGAKVTISWISVDSHGVAPANYKIDEVNLTIKNENIVTSTLTKPTNGWPVGTYRTDLAVDGTVLGSIDFEVK